MGGCSYVRINSFLFIYLFIIIFSLHQNKIFKGTEKVDFLRGQMNWDHQALEAWLEESAKRDEDALVLEKYVKVDEGKIKVRKISTTDMPNHILQN